MAQGRMKTSGRLIIAGVIAAGAFFGYTKAIQLGYIKAPGIMTALVPVKAQLPDLKDAQVTGVQPAALPETAPASVAQTLIRGAIWEWNAQMGLILANGGATTTKGSLMEKRNVNLMLYRQDDTGKMQEDLIACAKEIAGGAKQCSNGANFVIIMGDGAGQFAAAVNPQLKKLGDQYGVIVIGAPGYSRGEDAFMAPPEVKQSANNFRNVVNSPGVKGLLVAGVLRDGDWNIAMKWAADNNIKNNPDEKTYDPDALNWVNSSDYNVAAADYVAKKCEDRKLVHDGRPTGDTVHVCINSVVTWTPGDVTAVQQRGGLVKVVSSKEYRSQMPAVILGPKAFFEANRAEVTQMLAATFEGGDQVKAFDTALRKGAEISARLYADQDGNYWYKYFKGVEETDSQGNKVLLGGSAVNNLADNKILFGIGSGMNDNFRSTYTTFANIDVQQYPALFKDTPIPAVAEVEDKSYVTGAEAVMSDEGAPADVPQYLGKATGAVVSQRDYLINFDTGKATLTPSGLRQLNELKDNFAVASGLFIKVDGYTDATGDEARTNLPLSQARAEAVRAYLNKRAPVNFPPERFEVQGHGSQDAVASNATAAGRAANRRVHITLISQ